VFRRLVVVSLLGTALFAPHANAHGRANVSKVPAGTRREIPFVIEHGCGSSPTIRVAVRIPSEVANPVPTAKQGWVGAFDSKTSTVTWSGGSLAANKHGTFAITMTFPAGKKGQVLSFPLVQSCKVGTLRWIEGATSKYPAPTVTLT
jgi:periplasmic copper chaperone A